MEQGLRPCFMLDSLQVHGMLELLRHLPRLYRTLWMMEKVLLVERPDALLLIDYPGFNLKLAACARRLGIPVIFFNSPQVWAWRKGRLKTIRQNVDLMLVLFPFETRIYEQLGVEVHCVGHPLLDERIDESELKTFRQEYAIEQGQKVLMLAPGSRPSEIQRHLPVMLDSLQIIDKQVPGLRVLLPVAETLDPVKIEGQIAASPIEITPVKGRFSLAVHACDLAVVSSGTASLQTGLALKPFIVIYRVAPLTYWIARRLARIRHIGMVNVLAGREIVPELLQGDFTPERTASAVITLLKDEDARARMTSHLKEIRSRLGEPGAYHRTAKILSDFILHT